jgi:hypothetical protein
LSGDTLTLAMPAGPRYLGEVDVAEIRQRRDDSLKNGAIIGAVAGTAYYVSMAVLLSDSDGGDVIIGTALAGVFHSPRLAGGLHFLAARAREACERRMDVRIVSS